MKEVDKFQPISVGSIADLKAGVDISKVHGGYFANSENIKSFVDNGISIIEQDLPHETQYVDFGGAQGLLASSVTDMLMSSGHIVHTQVADANQYYLDEAKKRGLETVLCNLESCNLSDVDLITMRAVLHYNSPEQQKKILSRIIMSLKTHGYFIHQVSSGSNANTELRSALVNLPSLGRAGAGDYHWTSVQETLRLHHEAGFTQTNLVGYAPAASWGPIEQWDRFNFKDLTDAVRELDEKKIQTIENRRELYLREANAVCRQFLEKYGSDETGIESLSDGNFVVHYQYPIIVSRK